MPTFHRLISVFLLIVIAMGCQTAQRADSKKIESADGYKVLARRPDRMFVQLDNGLVVMAQRTSTAPVVSVQCFVKTGSIYEQEFNGLGLSHFLEHLVASGSTSTRDEGENNAILGRIGGQTNAGTGLDTVSYFVNTTSDHAATAIDMVSDWMQHSLIREEEFVRERDVIGREFAMGRGEPSRIFWKLTQEARFPPNHPARHPTIGYEKEFVEVTRDQVYDFYRRMYVPNNMVFVVVGDIDPADTVDQVAELWAASKPGELPEILLPHEKPITEPREVVGHADIDRPRLRLSWTGAEYTTREDYALDLLGRILGDGELSRLVQAVRNDKGLVTAIEASNWSFHWGKGLFSVDAVPEKGKIDEARAAILEVVERVAEGGVTAEELQRAKNKTVAETVYAAQTAEGTAERLAHDFLQTGNPDYMLHYAEAIRDITAAEVQAAARKYLKPRGVITVKLLPQEGPADPQERPADAPRGQTLVKNPDVKVIRLENDVLVKKMQQQQARADEAKAPRVSPIRMHKLSNGLRVIVHRNTRLPIVAMQWYQLGGLLADEPGQEGVANAMASMLMKGAGDRTAEQIATELENVGAQIGAEAGNSTLLVTSQSLAKNWPTVLEIMSDVILRPTFPQDEWQRMQPRLLAGIDSINDTWYGELRAGFREAYFGNHPWSQTALGRRPVVESLTPERLREYHGRHIAAESGVLAVFGDVEEKEVLKRAEAMFGDMPRKAPKPFDPPGYELPDPKYVHIPTAKPTPAVVIGYGPGIERADPDYPALTVMNGVLSSFPVGWFDRALRGEGQGLVYAVGAGVFTGPQKGYWSVLFNTQNETLKPAVEAALAVVDRIRTEKVDDVTLARARQAVLVDEAFNKQAYGQLATAAALDELYGLGYDHAEEEIELIRKVTAEDVRKAARKYLRSPLGVILSDKAPDLSALPPLKPAQSATAPAESNVK